MAVISLGRTPKSLPSAAAARDPRGARAPARVDLDALAEAVFQTHNRVDKARLFIGYLRATGTTGEIIVAEVEERYWEIMGASCRTQSDWNGVWISMSRQLGRELVKRQRWVHGARRWVLVIPVVASVQ